MPLLITPAVPFATAHALPVARVYAIIMGVSYQTRQRQIEYKVGYYASEQAYFEAALELQINTLPTGFVQAASPEDANAVPIFSFLESILSAQLQALLGADVLIENVA